MKKIQLFLVMLLVGIQVAAAQSMQISGKVTYADDGSPVIGATVMVKGTNVATLSDVNGMYQITIPSSAPDKILVAKYTGLKDMEHNVTASGQVIDFVMAADAQQIDNVVITAYGTTTKKAFTGSASVVKSDDIKNLQITSPTQALQGMASGVMSVSAMGQPGDSPTIRIRGIGSFVDGGGEPLIVVDGVAFNGNINAINPNDIESMTVLKDANSTSLYGSRAANGVILITTKSGRAGKARITAQIRYGISDRAVPEFQFVGAEEYMKMKWNGLYNDGFYADSKIGAIGNAAAAGAYASKNLLGELIYNPFNTGAVSPIGADGEVIDGAKLLYDQDWQKDLFQVGQRQEYDFQVTGGTDAVRYMVSAGLLDQTAIVRNSNFTRYSGRVKVDAKATSWLDVGMNSSISYSKQNAPNQESTYASSAIYMGRSVANIYPVYMTDKEGVYVLDAFGNMIPDFGGATSTHTGIKGNRPVMPDANPIGTALYDSRGSTRFMSNNIAYAQATFLKNFKLRTQIGVDYYHRAGEMFMNPLYGQGVSTKGVSEKYRELSSTITWTNTLTYDQTFNDDHHVNVLLGMESEDYNFNYLYASRTGYDFSGVTELDYGSTVNGASSYATASRNMRYMLRANYDYKSLYHFSGSLSYDGSSRFAEGNRWGLFYSVGAAWNISNEAFWTAGNVSTWFNNLKLRASYGTSGNQNVGSYFPYLSTYTAGRDMPGYGGSVVGRLGNNNLRWEKQHQFDVGLDFGFLNNVITLSVGYYDRTSQDLLMARPLPLSSGITSIYDNIGQVRNTGVELEISATPFNTKNVTWNIGFNVSTQDNIVLQLPESAVATGGMSNPGSTGKWLKEGSSSYTWYLREWAGVDPADGLPSWWKYTTNEDGTETRTVTKSYSEANQRMISTGLPTVVGGFNTNLSVYGVELGIICAFAAGHTLYNSDQAMLLHGFNNGDNGHQISADARGAWKNPGDITNIPRFESTSRNFGSASTRWLVPGDYLRIRNITLGYNFSHIRGVKEFGIQELRLYCSAENPFTFFATEGIDPEQGLAGSTNNYSSALRTISFGLNVTF